MSRNNRAKDFSDHTAPSHGARERILEHGPACLDTPELLSCLLGISVAEARAFLDSQVGAGLRNLEVSEVRALLTPARAAALLAAVELGRRVFLVPQAERSVVDSPQKAHAVLYDIAFAEVEHFAVLLLDVKNRLISKHVITKGTLDETLAYPRDVFRAAVRQNAAGIIIAHNHPSGSVDPSSEDLQLTRQLLECARTLQIPVLDHVIVAAGNYASLRRTTALWGR